MARRFHTRNGAVCVARSDETNNYEYRLQPAAEEKQQEHEPDDERHAKGARSSNDAAQVADEEAVRAMLLETSRDALSKGTEAPRLLSLLPSKAPPPRFGTSSDACHFCSSFVILCKQLSAVNPQVKISVRPLLRLRPALGARFLLRW